ncbi:hypothetical protein ACI2IY_00600 [Lysobacter enzymogenes]|uniref:hypothetical protein n=1 Tax=Lysobacter enzymogenes TaxID=69 RepID=UPI0038504DDA
MSWFSLRPWPRCRCGLWCALALQAARVSAVAVSSDRELLRAGLLRARRCGVRAVRAELTQRHRA